MRYVLLLCTIGTICTPALSDEAPLSAREQALVEMVKRLESRVEDLEKRLDAQESDKDSAVPVTPVASPSPEKSPEDMRVYWKDGIRMETEDGRLKLRVGGRIHQDWAWFRQDDGLTRAFGNSQDGTEFRRARLFVSGLLYDAVSFKAEYDFAGGDSDFKDVYMAMSDVPVVGTIRVGHYKEPFGLDELISDNAITFLERPLLSAFVPSRNTGVMLRNTAMQQRMTWAAGVFRTTDDYGNGRDDGDYSLTARVTGLPWYGAEGQRLLHLGAAYSHRPRNGAMRLRARPEAHLSEFRYVDTGTFESEDVDLMGFEAALKWGAFSLQGEYVRAGVDSVRRTNFTNFSLRDGVHSAFDGYYVAASYFLTGEGRPYDRRKGVFGRVRPTRNFSLKEGGGWGAWEVALRYSHLDLSDGYLQGGREANWTAGLNWYLNPHARVMLNYTHGAITQAGPSLSGMWRGRGYEGDIDILQTRFQVDF